MTARLWFSLAALAMISSPMATGLSGACAAENGAPRFQWSDHPEEGYTDLLLGTQPVVRYMYAFDTSTPEKEHDTYKVYHHVFGPGSDRVITKGPGGKYTHHRGLYVGWMTTRFEGKSLDFWHCKNGAHLRHVKFLKMEGDENRGTMSSEIHWNDAEGKPVIVEIRTLTVRKAPTASAQGPGYAWQIDWQSRLASRRGDIELDGDRQHAGFQFRADNHVAETNGATFIRPEGFPQQKEAFQVPKGDLHINLNWTGMSYTLDGTTYTIEYLEDPALPKPSRYSERPYGRFGAFFRTTLKADEPIDMRYRVIVNAGHVPSQAEIQQHYDEFVADLKRTAAE